MACKGLDAQVVRPQDPELTQLLQRFVDVRITNFRHVDMNRFRFDYDLTFAVLMMDAEGNTYSRFGSRDAQSETDRLSIAGLKRAMRAVLALPRQHPAAAAVAPGEQKPFTLDDIPAFKNSGAADRECAHCHYANNFRFLQLRAEGKFSEEMLYQYPLPENIGVTLDVDHNNVITSVRPGSPAEQAGVKAGDVILQADATPVLTCADLQFALNSVPNDGTVTLQLQRGRDRLPPATLHLPHGWRHTDISWRASRTAATRAAEAGATIRSIDVDSRTLTLFAGGRVRSVKVAPDVQVLDPEGRVIPEGLRSTQLKEGTEVTVTGEMENGEPVVHVIRLARRNERRARPAPMSDDDPRG